MYLSTVACFFIDGTNTVNATICYSKAILQLISLISYSFGNLKGIQTEDPYQLHIYFTEFTGLGKSNPQSQERSDH